MLPLLVQVEAMEAMDMEVMAIVASQIFKIRSSPAAWSPEARLVLACCPHRVAPYTSGASLNSDVIKVEKPLRIFQRIYLGAISAVQNGSAL